MAIPNTKLSTQRHSSLRLPISVDLVAVGIGLALAVLIRLGVIHHISF